METKLIINRFKLSIFFSFFVLTSFGQGKYLPGYIILRGGDTLKGSINYSKFLKKSKVLNFKVGENINTYTSADIDAYGTVSESYESAVIETGSDTAGRKNNAVFLQTLFNGSKSLYSYINDEGKDKFYIKNGPTFELLVYDSYEKNVGGRTIILENKKFLGQLNNYLHTPSLQPILDKTEYNEKSLKKLFLRYYEITKDDIHFQQKTIKVKPEFGLITGLTYSTLKFNGLYSPLGCTNFPSSVNFTTGIFFDVRLPKNLSRFSVNNELIYTSLKVEGQSGYYSVDKYSTNYSDLEFSYIKMNNMLRYRFPVGKISIYLNAGITNGLAFNVKNYLRIERDYFSQHTIDETDALYHPRKHEEGYFFGLGTKFKRLSCEIRNERGNGMSSSLTLLSRTNRYYLLLGYRF